MEFNMATLQQQVQQHLQNTGISLRELSRRSGISHQAIGKILRGGEYKNEREMLTQIDTLSVERENAETKHDQQIMRLRVYVWSPICAIVFLIVSGLVVWGGA